MARKPTIDGLQKERKIMRTRTPKSVKNQAKEAESLQNALNQPPADASLEDANPVVVEQAAEVVALKEDENLDPNLDPPKTSAELSTDQGSDWEKRFKGMKNLYDREVPKLRGQLDEAYTKINGFQSEIDDVKQLLQEAEQKPAELAPASLELSDEEREQYGEGWIEMMQKISGQGSSELAKQVVDLQKEISSLKQGQNDIQKTVQINTAHDFTTELARVVKDATGKDWKDINKDSEFHAFLSETVPYTNNERQHFLMKAKDNLDVSTAAQFFIDFAGSLSSENVSLKKPSANSVPDELLQPENAGNGGLPPIKESKVYVSSEIDQFYRDKREGKYKGKESEAREIESDILLAGREGRIVEKRRYVSA